MRCMEKQLGGQEEGRGVMTVAETRSQQHMKVETRRREWKCGRRKVGARAGLGTAMQEERPEAGGWGGVAGKGLGQSFLPTPCSFMYKSLFRRRGEGREGEGTGV